MSVAGVSSSSLFDYNTLSMNNKLQQFQQVFQQLGQDLQSGNLSAAQTDFATLQQSPAPASSSSSAPGTSTIAQDLKQLSQDLQSGNVSSAQQDYAKIRQDFQSQAAGSHGHHHHHGGGGGGSAISQLLQQLGQELQSGDLSSAQQSYNALQQDFLQSAPKNGLLQASANFQDSTFSVNA